jgi:phosphoglycolate phosphatase
MRPLCRPSALAFDLDGTLVDSRLDIAATCNHVLAAAGRPALHADVIATFVGDGVRALLARAFEYAYDDAHLGPLTDTFVAYYAAHPADHTTWMPGALGVLDAVAAWPLAVVTNKARAVTLAVLEALGTGGRFAFVYAGGDGPLKPSAAPIVAVARALRVEPSALWVVGDGDQDILAARAAGSFAVAVRGGFTGDERLRAASPDAFLSSLAELPALIQRAAS